MEFIEFLFPFQERLSYIGPEEFIQAFEKKDPLDNDKVLSTIGHWYVTQQATVGYHRVLLYNGWV